MRIAALYDIHGNLPALEAVLGEVQAEGVDRIVVGGDVVPGPLPRECMASLRGLSLPIDYIRGNGEADLLALRRGEPPARLLPQVVPLVRWALDALPPEILADMASWPARAEWESETLGRLLFCHATPRDDNEIFTRLTPEDRLLPVFDAVAADVVICGHTHMQFQRTVAGRRVVNAGSVGMPFGDPVACWALLGPDIELRRTPYDLASASLRLGVPGYPGAPLYDVAAPPSEARMLALYEAAALI